MLSKQGEIRRDEACLDYAGTQIILYPCHGSKGNQYWEYDDEVIALKSQYTIFEILIIIIFILKLWLIHFLSRQKLSGTGAVENASSCQKTVMIYKCLLAGNLYTPKHTLSN